MKKFGIIGAMEVEVQMLKEAARIETHKSIAGMDFMIGTLEGQGVVLVTSGIGKVNAAVCAQVLISEFGVTHVVNTGVAGAIHQDLEVGDLVVSTDLLEHDFDATGFGYEPGQIPRMDEWIFKADDQLIDYAMEASTNEEITHKVITGRIVTGDVFVSDKERKDFIWKQFKGFATEMEGAAIAHACHMNDVPFLILRAMSDKADGTAHESFDEFCNEAALNSSRIVRGILRHS